jgi:hypothetical protein
LSDGYISQIFFSLHPGIFAQRYACCLAFHSGFPVPCKNFPEAIQEFLGISQWLFYILLAVTSDCPIVFKSISQRLLAKKFYKKSQWFLLSYFCSLQSRSPTTFSQSQSCATVSLTTIYRNKTLFSSFKLSSTLYVSKILQEGLLPPFLPLSNSVGLTVYYVHILTGGEKPE